jgi:hypothetical protein
VPPRRAGTPVKPDTTDARVLEVTAFLEPPTEPESALPDSSPSDSYAAHLAENDSYGVPADGHLRSATRIRLAEHGAGNRHPGYPYRTFAPGLVELLVADLPNNFPILSNEQVDRLGGWNRLYREALARQAREPAGVLTRLAAGNGASYHQLRSPPELRSNRAVQMPQLATELTGEKPGRYGWLLAVPCRDTMFWHHIRDASALDVIPEMAAASRTAHTTRPWPLSQCLYWWSGLDYRQIISFASAAEPDFRADPDFVKALLALHR